MNSLIMKLMMAIPLLLVPGVGYAYQSYTNEGYDLSRYESDEDDDYDSEEEEYLLPYQGEDDIDDHAYCYEMEDSDDSYECCIKMDDCDCCPQVCCGRGFICADLLYWRAFQGGLDICVPTEVTDTTSGGGLVTSTFRGKGRDPHFNWRPGFRVGIGYVSAYDEWDVGAIWTYFHSHAQRGDQVRWNIDFGIVDVLAGYRVRLSPCFTLRPFAGLRGARINQKLRIQSSTLDLIVDNNSKQNFWGLGPLLGLEADWGLGCGFSLYSNGSISWLYGNSHLKLIESDTSTDAINYCDVRKHLNATLVSADVGVGVRWQTCLCQNRLLVLQCGLEHHHYFDYNRICDGDLSFDGINFSAGIEF